MYPDSCGPPNKFHTSSTEQKTSLTHTHTAYTYNTYKGEPSIFQSSHTLYQSNCTFMVANKCISHLKKKNQEQSKQALKPEGLKNKEGEEQSIGIEASKTENMI